VTDAECTSDGPGSSSRGGGPEHLRRRIAEVPTGREKLKWYGPGFVWMVSSVGSGSILFTPRVGSRYGYELLWAAFFVAFLTWVIIREIGRYSVVSGRTLLDGYHDLPGPRGWAVWFIFIPGIVSGVVVVAGIAGLVGSALVIVLPVSQAVSAIGVILVSAALILTGKYRALENVTMVMAVIMIVTVVLAAVAAFPGWTPYATGLVPGAVADFDLYFVLPWFGFLLAGAAGMMWFSYWVAARGYGGKVIEEDTGEDEPSEHPLPCEDVAAHLRPWLAIMSTTAAIGVIGATLVNLSFLTLGAELLRPLGVIPEGVRVAEDLARMLGDIWGDTGTYLLVAGILVALWGSVLSNQDGWGRMYADATMMLFPRWTQRVSRGVGAAALRERLKTIFVLAALTAAPIALFLALRDPVAILSIAGLITAAHLPVVVSLTLYLNLSRLPRDLGPGPVWIAASAVAILFYGGFSALFFFDLLRGMLAA
jgi:Mn2+/Fe2+ NRAMP family transporter